MSVLTYTLWVKSLTRNGFMLLVVDNPFLEGHEYRIYKRYNEGVLGRNLDNIYQTE